MALILPVEIWENIIECMPRRDQAVCCVLSQSFNIIATRILYRHISLDVTFTSVYSLGDCLCWRDPLLTIAKNERNEAEAVRCLELKCVYYCETGCSPPHVSEEPHIEQTVYGLLLDAVCSMPRLEEFIWNTFLPLPNEIMEELARRPITKFRFQDWPNVCDQISIAPLVGTCPFKSLAIDTGIIDDDREFKTLLMFVQDTLRHLTLWRGVYTRPSGVFEPIIRSGKKLKLITLECFDMYVVDMLEIIEAVDLATLRTLVWIPKDSETGQRVWGYLLRGPLMSLQSLSTDRGDHSLRAFLRSFSGLQTLLLGDWGRKGMVNVQRYLPTHCWTLKCLRLPTECESQKAYIRAKDLEWLMSYCINLEELSCSMHPDKMFDFMYALCPAKRLRLLHVKSTLPMKTFLSRFFDILRPEHTTLFDNLQMVAYGFSRWAIRPTFEARRDDEMWEKTMESVRAAECRKSPDGEGEGEGEEQQPLSMAYLHELCCQAIFQTPYHWELALSCHGKTPVSFYGYLEQKRIREQWKLHKWMIEPERELSDWSPWQSAEEDEDDDEE